MIIKSIDMKTSYGTYTSFEKQFNDEGHYQNWYRLMSRKGHKIVGVSDIETVA